MEIPKGETSFDDLIALVARLHAPAPDGCPWCLAQTPATLADELVKEAYEAVAAARGLDGSLAEELGDVLLIVLAMLRLGADRETLTQADVLAGLHEKVVRRHPHIFGDAVATTPAEVLKSWETVKRSERAEGASILEGIPSALPALLRAEEMQQRVARVGFDWPDVDGVVDKIREEVDELRAATTSEAKLEEFGDLLFALANLARWLGFSPERALQEANTKFARRFAHVEELCRLQGVKTEDLSLEALDALWTQVKAGELRRVTPSPLSGEGWGEG